MNQQDKYKKSAGLITSHYGEEYEHYYNAIVPPVFMNSLHVFEDLDSYFAFDRQDKHGYCYGRVQNPTVRILEGVGSLAFSSGMAAATTAVLTVCKRGSHILCVRGAYSPLRIFLDTYCKEHMDIEVTYIKGDEISQFEEAIQDNTSLVILESPSSIVFSLQDIQEVSRLAKAHNALVYIDNTYCTSLYQKPLNLGADIVMHTTSKYIGGHSDVIGGVLAVKDKDLLKKLLTNRELLGNVLGPMEAWLMIRGLRTLEVRLATHEASAIKVASFLEDHPKVDKVYYPGLASHPQRELVKKQQKGSSGLLSFEIKGDVEAAKKLVESLEIFKIGVSWGGFESLAFLPHYKLSEEECEFLGGKRNVIRLHCGLEDVDFLVEDLAKALEKI